MAKTKKPVRMTRRIAWAMAALLFVFLAAWLILAAAIRASRIPDSMKQPPPELTAFAQTPASQSARSSRRSSDHPAWDRPLPPKTFEDYVRFQLERNSNDEGAKLYLALLNRFASEKFNEQWIALFEPQRLVWRPGSALNDSQRQWLVAHREWIELARKMVAAGGPPTFLPGEFPREGFIPRDKIPRPNFSLLHSVLMLLAAESERLRESHDFIGAAGILLDEYALSEEPIGQRNIGFFVASSMRKSPDRSLAGWLRDDPPNVSILKRIQDALDAAHDVTRRHVSEVAGFFAEARSAGIYLQDQPVSQWLNERDPMVAEDSDFYRFYSRFKDKPAFMWDQAYAVLRSKLRARTNLRDFDALTADILQRFEGPYSSLALGEFQERLGQMTANFSPFAWTDIGFFESLFSIPLSSEAETNLNRAAIRLLQGEKPAPDLAADPNADAWLDSPWRDPFTETPLHIQDDGDTTLIYSLGPDQKDQGGTLVYDPTNGTISEGDLAIRIPRR